MDLLSSEELFFAHLPTLEDGLEGSLTARTRDKLFKWFRGQYRDATLARQELEQYEKHREGFFVNCWHMNNSESYLMWKVYGGRGFAIRTTFERVQIAFDRFPGEINGGVVEYIDFEREGTAVGNVFTHVVNKDLPYRDEREFRLLFWQLDPANKEFHPSPKGIGVRVDLEKLIDKIYVSPSVRDVPSALYRLVESKKMNCSIVSSVINERVAC